MIEFHKRACGWYYISIAGWRPFEYFRHGGWFCLNRRWFWQNGRAEHWRRKAIAQQRREHRL